MMISCPSCASAFELVAGIEDADGRRWHALVCELPPSVIKPLVRYLRLFKPKKQGLRWSRMLKITQELVPMIQHAELKHNHATYAAPAELWANMMTALVDNPASTLVLPLKSNGYLLSMIAGSAEKDAARFERKKEETLQQRAIAPATRSKPEKVANYIPGGWAAELKKTINGGGRGDRPGGNEGKDSGADTSASGAGRLREDGGGLLPRDR